MKSELTVEELLRWRLARAEAEAPRAPRAAHLLALARPWWETWPERFQRLVERVSRIETAYGYAMAEPNRGRSGHPVATLVVRGCEEVETAARVLYFNIRDGRLRLRFQLDAPPGQAQETLEATFINDKDQRPVLSAQATLSVDCEYRIDSELSAELARTWETLKVTDRMPFRLILRADKDSS
jgi:hypothetical protein